MDDIILPLDPQSNLVPETTFIYKLIDPETNEIRYVGKSNNPQKRLLAHVRDQSNTYKGHWLISLRNRGLKPIMEIVEEVPFEIWAERELYWISYYLEHGHPLTNTYFGSEGIGIIPPEVRAKLSVAHKGKKVSPEAIAKTAAARRGTKHVPETIAKISAAKLGIKRAPRSEEWQRKLNESIQGRKHAPETIAKMSASAKNRKPRTFSEEAKRNIGEAHRGNKQSPETRAKISEAKRGRKASPEARANMSLGKKRARAMKLNPPDAPTLFG